MIVVTGGAGFIGSCLVKYLNELGYFDIIVVDELDDSLKWHNLRGISFKDFLHKDDFLENFERFPQVNTIYHLGASSSTMVIDGNYLFRNNYEYTKKLCFKAINRGTKFVYASSAATYGDGAFGYSDVETDLVKLVPLNLYAYSKHMFDLFAQRHDFFNKHKIIGLKFFNIYGPAEAHKKDSSSVIFKSYQLLKQGNSLSLYKSYNPKFEDGEQLRDFLYVKDAVKLTVHLANHPKKLGGIYNIGSGKAKSFNQLVSALEKALDKKFKVDYIEMPPQLRDHYQYFTEADMKKTFSTAFNDYPLHNFYSFDDAIKDYVVGYLMNNNFTIKANSL